MTAGRERKATVYLFCLAALVWALTTFPCVHLLNLYEYHHMKGIGLHPEFVAAYYRTITITTLWCSLLGTSILWYLTKRLRSETRDPIFWGILPGVVFAFILWGVINPDFRLVSAHLYQSPEQAAPLDFGNFLYAGLLAGAVTGEIRFRSLRSKSVVARSADERKVDFYILALMTWAVILKMFGCFELVTIPAGRPVPEVGAHLVMLLSVALWVPAIWRFLWKHPPKHPISMIPSTCAAGVLLPPLISCVLYFPLFILLYMGFPPVAFAALWGIKFVSAAGIWKLVLSFTPGLVWGITVGLLGWNDFQGEKNGR